MAREFFKNKPDKTTPFSASRWNSLLNGEEAMGSIRVDDVIGKNLFDKDDIIDGYYWAEGKLTHDSNMCCTNSFIKVEPNKKYTFSCGSKSTIFIEEYAENKTYIKLNSNWDKTEVSITTQSTTEYVRLSFTKATKDTTQFEKGSATEYTPYKKFGYNSQESMGKIVVDDIECKNLLPIGETESITLSNTYFFDKPLEIGKYYLNAESVTSNGTKGVYVFVFRNTNGQDQYVYLEDGNLKEGFTTSYEFDRVTIYSQDDWANSQNITTTFNKTMLVKGHTQLPYTKYRKIGDRANICTNAEIATNEYIDGKRVYVKRINFGALPNTTTKSVTHGLTNFTPVRISGIANTGTYYINLPHVATTTTGNIQIGVSATAIEITTGQDRSGFTGIVDIYYTKNTQTAMYSPTPSTPEEGELDG